MISIKNSSLNLDNPQPTIARDYPGGACGLREIKKSVDLFNLEEHGYVTNPEPSFYHTELPECCVLVNRGIPGPTIIVTRREQYVTHTGSSFINVHYYVAGLPEVMAIEETERIFADAMVILEQRCKLTAATSVLLRTTILPDSVVPAVIHIPRT